MHSRKRLIPILTLAIAIPTIAAFPVASHVQAASQRAGVTGKIAFLMSDFTTSPRWQFDKKFFIQDIKKLDPGVSVVVYDAKAAQTNQQNQAKSALTSGAKLLIDVPVDSAQAASIVREAHANKPRVPVIAYDRLIMGAYEDAYASFNGFAVGVQQGKFLKAHVAKGGTIVSIAGSPTDNNAHLFYNGAMSVLHPLVASGYYKLGYDKFTPNWDQATAQQEMASALNQLSNKVNGVLVANDTMAGGVITALAAQKLAGKIPVTGQDASAAGIQQICLGNQSMTIYKPVIKLAKAAAGIADSLLHHKAYKSSVHTATGAGGTPSAILPVITVTKANLAATVIKDGYVTKAQVPQCHL
ncbi:MAG TPA: substrate-binding domain-containing protein [Chloroflexota bacterium]